MLSELSLIRIQPDTALGVEIQDKIKQELKLLGSITLRKGMRLWEINTIQRTIREAPVVKTKSVSFQSQKPIEHSKVVIMPDCFYLVALNKRNAIRKYNQRIMEAKMMTVKKKGMS